MSKQKWHINNNGEAKRCYAKNNCRFGGKSGFDDHFYNEKEALERSSEILAKRYGEFAQPQKKGQKAISQEERKRLIDFGLKESGKLSTTKDDVIESGFKNNRKSYEKFQKFAKESSKYSPQTRESIGKMLSKGISVNSVESIEEASSSRLHHVSISESGVDVIEESVGKPTLNELISRHGIPKFGSKK